MNTEPVYFTRMQPDVQVPTYETPGAAGCDVRLYSPDGKWLIPAGFTSAVPTGLKVKIPVGFELQVRPRSGLSLKTKLRVANAPGTIDSDYRGEIKIILTNTGNEDILLNHGDRIAQLVLCPVYQASFIEVDSLDETTRGEGGFGSTGV